MTIDLNSNQLNSNRLFVHKGHRPKIHTKLKQIIKYVWEVSTIIVHRPSIFKIYYEKRRVSSLIIIQFV